ncbi:hypothetical protein R1A27_22190 [Methylobacterium sp. NMS12]|uniref:hypothetical protein n=1 Tax=Methylobacterium sp. NMS12 TaxID=3079766 RepID=UPI003F885246
MSAAQEAEKLSATWFNNVGVAIVATGFIGPGIKARDALVNHEASALYIFSMLLWLAAGWGVHLYARDRLVRRFGE